MRKGRLDIDQLWQGISQQPDWRRQNGQVDLAKNVRLDVLEGARKRNSTYIHAELGLRGDSGLPYVVTMRQFYLFIYSWGIIAYDRDLGGNIPVNTPNGYGYLANATVESMDSTIAIDTIVLLNRNKIPNTRHTPAYTVKDTVNIFSELPKTGVQAGDIYEVLNSENFDPPGHYLYIDPANPSVPTGFILDANLFGNWQRVPAPFDASARYVGSTMPHRLYYDPTAGANGEFTFEEIPWKDRLSGNAATNPKMPWIRDGLNAVSFHQGRLFLIGNSSVTAGASSPNQDIFNLYVNNINTVVDSDPISIDINLPNIGNPLRCAPIGQDLFLTCQNGQVAYSASAGAAFTPSNGQYRQVGNFRAKDIPLATNGSEIVLLDEFNRVQLFGLSNTSAIQYVTYYGSLNDHAPTLLKNDTIRRLHLIETTLFITTTSNKVWCHERFSQGGQIVQLAWSEMEFYEPTYFMDAWKNQVYLLSSGDAFMTILRYQHIKNTDDQDDFLPRLDRLQAATLAAPFASYDHLTNTTRIEFLGRTPTVDNAALVTPDGAFWRPDRVNGKNAFFSGDFMGLACQWGFTYEALMSLSNIFPQSDVRPTLSRIVLGLKDTSNFELVINNPDRTARSVNWNAPYTTGYTLGAKTGYTGIARFPCQGDARTTNVIVKNNTPGTFTLSFVEYYLQQGSN